MTSLSKKQVLLNFLIEQLSITLYLHYSSSITKPLEKCECKYVYKLFFYFKNLSYFKLWYYLVNLIFSYKKIDSKSDHFNDTHKHFIS